jgi:hypothetical protein
MPVVFTLSFFGARAVTRAWTRRNRPLRYALALIAFAVVSLGLMRGLDLTYAMLNDSRYAAQKWLNSRTHVGTVVETFGPPSDLPPLNAGVITRQPIERVGVSEPRVDQEAVRTIADGWRTRKPDFVIIMPDYTSPVRGPYSLYCPPSVYRDLLNGGLGYRLVASFETGDLLPWVRRPDLDYASVNPPIRIFARDQEPAF